MDINAHGIAKMLLFYMQVSWSMVAILSTLLNIFKSGAKL